MKLRKKKLSAAFISLLLALSMFDFIPVNREGNNFDSAVNTVEAKSYTRKRLRGNQVYAGRGRIIGNRRSKIYHVPGQAGYWLNSSNAVYFKTEREAINAGYRKSLR